MEFNYICERLLHLSELHGHIPTKKMINDDTKIPKVDKIMSIFKENGFNSYTDYLKEKGYKLKHKKSKFANYTIHDLISHWELYFSIHGKYPTSLVCNTENSLPSWKMVKRICGKDFNDFYERFGESKIIKTKSYEEYCEIFINVSKKKGKALNLYDLIDNDLGLPTSRWFIQNCPNDKVKTYNDFISYLGLKPNYHISKDHAIKQIMIKYESLNRHIKILDFYNPIGEEIGIKTINNHWGTFNNMLTELNLPINQEDMISRQRPIGELKEDINRLCEYIYKTEGRKNISRDEINNCEWCLSVQAYDRWFKRELNMTVGDYIESIGYIPNKAGMGMVYEFEDGEVTTSKFEYDVSIYLRENNYTYSNTYNRNVRYKEFILDYEGNMDCDYVIKKDSEIWFVEVAGMLDYSKVNKKKDDKIRERYKEHLNVKIRMLSDSNLNYKIIYPSDFQTKSFDEIFYFLYN